MESELTQLGSLVIFIIQDSHKSNIHQTILHLKKGRLVSEILLSQLLLMEIYKRKRLILKKLAVWLEIVSLDKESNMYKIFNRKYNQGS